jgi:glutamyl-tRNA reductase
MNGRLHAAQKCEEIILQKTSEFIAWLQSFERISQTIRSYRNHVESLCQIELNKAIAQLNKGEDPERVLSRFADLFMNKLLHAPSVQLRKIGLEGRLDILEVAQQLLITDSNSC